jgi:hypothetical protein
MSGFRSFLRGLSGIRVVTKKNRIARTLQVHVYSLQPDRILYQVARLRPYFCLANTVDNSSEYTNFHPGKKGNT